MLIVIETGQSTVRTYKSKLITPVQAVIDIKQSTWKIEPCMRLVRGTLVQFGMGKASQTIWSSSIILVYIDYEGKDL